MMRRYGRGRKVGKSKKRRVKELKNEERVQEPNKRHKKRKINMKWPERGVRECAILEHKKTKTKTAKTRRRHISRVVG